MRRAGPFGYLAFLACLFLFSLPAGVLGGGVPDQLFHASFDRTADLADFAFGSPAEIDSSGGSLASRMRRPGAPLVPGPFGSALAGARSFDAHGNVSLPRGAVSFWYRQAEPPGQMYYPVFELRSVEQYFWWRFLSIHGMHGEMRVELVDRDCVNRLLTLPEWKVGEWQHLVVNWDHLEGVAVYLDGRPAAATPPGTRWAPGRMHLDAINLPAGRGGAYDEVRVFSRPLDEDEVRLLYRENRFEERPGLPAPDPCPVSRREELGWHSLDGMPLLEAGKPLTAASVPVREARQLKRWVWRGVDGIEGTFFPSNFQGYRFLDGGGYHLELEEGARIDHLRITGRFRGDIFGGSSLRRPPEEEKLVEIEPGGFLWTALLDPPLETARLNIFKRPLEGEADWWSNDNERGGVAGVADRRARLRNLQAFELLGGRPEKSFSRTAVFRPGPGGHSVAGLPEWFARALVTLHGSGDRDNRLLFRDYLYNWEEPPRLDLVALRPAHLFSPETDLGPALGRAREQHLDAIGFAWRGAVAAPTALRVDIRDPLTPRRELVSLDVRLEGEGPFELTLDHPGLILPQGRRFWIMLTAAEDLRLDDFRVSFHYRDSKELRSQYAGRQLGWLRDLFMYLSEPRPWSRVETREDAAFLGRAMYLKPLGDMYEVLAEFRRHFPDEPLARGIDTWTRPAAEHPPGSVVLSAREKEAPEWAAYARACLEMFLEMARWWVENRQVETGEFGSAVGDDSVLVQDWPSLALVSDPGGTLRDSFNLLAEYAWNERIRDGLNIRTTDTLHAYEEGINLVPHQLLINYGNPVFVSRLMESARAVRERLMGYSGGHLHFRSWWFGADRVVTEGRYGVDGPWNSLMLHPAMNLAWYGGYPSALETLTGYARAWLEDYRHFGQDNMRFAVSFEDHALRPRGATNVYGFGSLLNAVHRLAGEPDVRPLLSEQPEFLLQMIDSLRNDEFLLGNRELLERARSVDLGPLRTEAMDDARFCWMYLGWLLGGDEKFLADGARRLAERTAVTLPMQTVAEQSADRVMLSKKMIERMYLGGVAAHRNDFFPRHEVSYEGLGENFAALVHRASPDGLLVRFYNFGEGTAEGLMRVWNLVPGEYEVRSGAWDDGRGTIRGRARRARLKLKRYEPVPLSLPPGRQWAVEIRLLRAGTPLHERADLALAAEEMAWDPENGRLTVRVHNIGARETGPFTLRVLAGDGRELRRLELESLEAPADLVPRLVEVGIDGLDAAAPGPIEVEVMPGRDVEEITRVNNRATFRLGL